MIRIKELVTVKVDYFIPDYSHVINEFLWQTDDYWPEIPRVHQFLIYWKDNIEAPINNVFVQHALRRNWRRVDSFRYYQ